MGGNLVDLSGPHVVIPDPVVIDANVAIALVDVSLRTSATQAAQAAALFQHVRHGDQQAILTPTAYTEFLHVAIMGHYRSILKQHGRAVLSRRLNVRITDERSLLKHDPSILQQYVGDLERWREALANNNVIIANPDQLGPIASGRSHQEDLVQMIGRYGLDSNDAAILLETHRLGLSAIVSMDHDMQRALTDFDIYNWL